MDLDRHRGSRKSAKVFKHIVTMIGIGHQKELKEMLSHSDTNGKSIAHLAFNHSPDIARLFLEHGIELNFIDATFR